MKKIASALAITSLLLSLTTPVLAKDGSSGGDGSTSGGGSTSNTEQSGGGTSGGGGSSGGPSSNSGGSTFQAPKPPEGGGDFKRLPQEIKQRVERPFGLGGERPEAREKAENEVRNLREREASESAEIKTELKTKLQTFHNQQKAQITQKISDQLNLVNQKITSEMLRHIDKMSALLDKIQTRVSTSQVATSSASLSNANAAIANARTKIATAREAVLAQQTKDYTLVVSSESAVKSDAKVTRDLLRSDLQRVRNLVIVAKQTVAAAAEAAGLVRGEVENEASGSAHQ